MLDVTAPVASTASSRFALRSWPPYAEASELRWSVVGASVASQLVLSAWSIAAASPLAAGKNDNPHSVAVHDVCGAGREEELRLP
jgi:hypothetical protein